MTAKEIRNLIADTFYQQGQLKGTCYLREDLFDTLVKEQVESLKNTKSSIYYKQEESKKEVNLNDITSYQYQQYIILKRKQDKLIELI